MLYVGILKTKAFDFSNAFCLFTHRDDGGDAKGSRLHRGGRVRCGECCRERESVLDSCNLAIVPQLACLSCVDVRCDLRIQYSLLNL